MADSKLRLQIVTALDNAGIKATKDQIESLNKTLNKTASSGAGLNEVERTIGKMEGPFGKLQELFEKSNNKLAAFGTKAIAVAAAFKAGWDIGEWINDKVIRPLFGITDPIETLKKQNRQLKKEISDATEAFTDRSQRMASASADQIQSIDSEIGNIDKLRQAWTKVHKAKNDYYNSNEDLEIQKLERDRFEDIVALEAEGDYEGAEQANAIYDFLRAQLEAKKQIATFDRESAVLNGQIEDATSKEARLVEKQLELETRMVHLKKEREKIETDDHVGHDARSYRRLVAINENEQRKIRYQQRQNEIAISNANKEIDAYQLDLATRQNRRVLLADQLNLGIDKAAWNYDKSLIQNGNLLGFNFTDDFIEKFNEAGKQSTDDLVKAIANGVSEGIGRLLEAK